jgi:hypothetical protein
LQAIQLFHRALVAKRFKKKYGYGRNKIGKTGWERLGSKKALGKGTFGIVGHWTYDGADRDKIKLVDVVVKQGNSRNGGFVNEAGLYAALNTTKSVHFPTL